MRDCYGKSVQAEPDEPRSRLQYGTMLLVTGRFAAAADQLRAAVAIRPDWAGAHDTLGVCLLHLGRPAEAAAEFEPARSLNPDLPLLPKHLAEAGGRPATGR